MRKKQPRNEVSLGRGSIHALRLFASCGPITQPQAADKLNVSLPAVLFHRQKLSREGLIKPVKLDRQPERGRPSELWDIDKERNFTVGFTVVPSYLLMGLSDFGRNIVIQKKADLSTITNQESFINLVDGFILQSNNYVDQFSGIIRSVFMGLPGRLHAKTGMVQFCANMPLLIGLDIEKHIDDKFSLFCRVLPNQYAFYFGEQESYPADTTLSVIEWELGLGHATGCNNEIFSAINTNSTILKGIRDIAHMRIVLDGRPCHCGRRGCLEAYTAGWAILEQLNRSDMRTISDIVKLAQNGDAQVLDELKKAMRFLGIQLTWIIRLYGTERVIFTGPLSEIFPLVRESFCYGLREYLTEEEVRTINPVASVNPNGRIISGSCLLAKHLFLYPEAYTAYRGTIDQRKDAFMIENQILNCPV